MKPLYVQPYIYVTSSIISYVALGVCSCLTSHQQPRPYEDGPKLSNSLILQTGEARDLTIDLWFTRLVV